MPSPVRALLVFLALSLSTVAWAAKDPVYTGFLSNTAAGGYDVTAYFSEGKPVEGDSKFHTEYMGAEWHFASRENLDKFLAEPEKYTPQYGGYCAWAAANGYTAKGDPNHWAVHNGKLYLNYDGKVQATWNTDRDGFITRADANWPAILDN